MALPSSPCHLFCPSPSFPLIRLDLVLQLHLIIFLWFLLSLSFPPSSCVYIWWWWCWWWWWWHLLMKCICAVGSSLVVWVHPSTTDLHTSVILIHAQRLNIIIMSVIVLLDDSSHCIASFHIHNESMITLNQWFLTLVLDTPGLCLSSLANWLCSIWHTIIQLLLYCSMLCEYYVNLLYAWNARITSYSGWNLMYASEYTEWDTVSQKATHSMWRLIFKRVSELEVGNSNYKCYTWI